MVGFSNTVLSMLDASWFTAAWEALAQYRHGHFQNPGAFDQLWEGKGIETSGLAAKVISCDWCLAEIDVDGLCRMCCFALCQVSMLKGQFMIRNMMNSQEIECHYLWNNLLKKIAYSYFLKTVWWSIFGIQSLIDSHWYMYSAALVDG